MPPIEDEVVITEISEFEPSRVDGVGKGANGFPILMLKSIDGDVTETETDLDGVLSEAAKADDTDLPDATVDDLLEEINKTADPDDDRPPCKLCKGKKTIRNGAAKCPQCKGSGFQPMVGQTEKELLDAFKASDGAAASGAEVPLPDKCPTCNGSGTMRKDGKQCVDCGGSGKDGKTPTDDALHRMDASDGKITEGAGGRETIDKSVDDVNLYDDDETNVEKAKLKTKQRDALPDSAFALPGTREYPIQDENHARSALSLLHNASPDEQKKIKAAVHRRYPDIGNEAEKADGTMFSGANAALTAMAAKVSDDGPDANGDAGTPGSAAWEAVDAQTATDAAMALIAAGELMRAFAQREAQEVAAGEGNDVFDTYVVSDALCGVNHAVGIMAQMAFHEGLAAAKGLPDDEVVEKAGRRLAGKTITALTGARDKANDLSDHITGVLGNDDPAKKSDKTGSAAAKFIERANKAQLEEELSNMSTDELEKVLDARDEKLVGLLGEALKNLNSATTEVDVDADADADVDTDGDAEKGKSAMDNAAGIAGAKTENSKGKNRKKKVAMTDDVLEDEATQGNATTANTSPKGASKAEADSADDVDADVVEDAPAEKAEVDMTSEEIEARDARKAAKKQLKEARRAEKQAAENAAVAKAIEEGVAKAQAAVNELQERLATVEKMAAPSAISKTRPPDAVNKSAQKDELELELAKCERNANQTSDLNVRKEYNDRAKALRVRISALNA